jgi:four helix bundle protein
MPAPIEQLRIRGYRDLVIWKKALSLVVACYAIVRSLPEEERWDLGRQLRRACTAIPINIAEGSGRRGRADYARFLAIARGSLSEVEACIALIEALGYVPAKDLELASQLADEVGRMLTAMLRRQLSLRT